MGKTRRGLTLLAAVSLSAACTDRTPTGPATAAAATEGVSTQAVASPGRVSRPRVVAPREFASDPLIGAWGGDHVRITVGAARSTLEYDCAHGTIDEPFAVDASGRFNLAGTHVIETPGPIRENDDPLRHPARYTGSTDGRLLTYTVTLTDSNETLGPFALALNGVGRVLKCL